MAEPNDTQTTGTADAAAGGSAQQASAGAGGYTAGGHIQTQDVGQDELLQFASQLVAANMKRTMDQYQTVDNVKLADERTFTNSLNQLTLQLLQGAITDQSQMRAQTLRHADLALKNQWDIENIVEAVTAKVMSTMAEKGGINNG